MPSPIHIAQVVEAVEGGCRRHVRELAAGLDAERFRQTIIFSPRRDPGFAATIARAAGNAVETVPWQVHRAIRPGADLAAYRFLRELLRERRFDVVHCHSAKAGLLGRLAARGLGAATVYTPHCFPFRMETSGFARAAYLALERFAGRFTDRLVAVAPSEADLARAAGVVAPDRIVTIENGIDMAPFGVTGGAEAKRAELGIGVCDPVILSIGALRPQKGHRYLIEAVPAVLREHPQVRVLIAGEGALRPQLAELIARRGVEQHVRLLGQREDVPELLGVANCLALSSLWEGGPYTLLEAMAASAPVVGSRIPGITDWVREGETGRLAEPGDPAGLATQISRTLAEPEASRRMAAAARELVRRRNTRERWLAQMTALYEELASTGSRAGAALESRGHGARP